MRLSQTRSWKRVVALIVISATLTRAREAFTELLHGDAEMEALVPPNVTDDTDKELKETQVTSQFSR